MDNKKIELYNKAKEAYYNGEEIMPDITFDELEEELGLENKAYVGSKGPSYTIKHPIKMGSLSKVQIKFSEGTEEIEWGKYYNNVLSYLKNMKASDNTVLDTPLLWTPKYDGCSFEFYHTKNDIYISTRGDGDYGKDIKEHIISKFPLDSLSLLKNEEYILRGEVLVDKNVFLEKYSDKFTNPRSFVAGILGRKYEDIEDKSVLTDLCVVVYDYRILFGNNWMECDWMTLKNILPNEMLPLFVLYDSITDSFNRLQDIYDQFLKYRSECKYALDGIVVKPNVTVRLNNTDRVRPLDCVAIKFTPMIKDAVVTDIQWQLGKTSEYTPVVIFDEVLFDGKKVNKASGHNYGFIRDNKIQIGTKIKVSLAGDIIPFIYKVENTDKEFIISTPDNTYCQGCHLYKLLNNVEEMHLKFIASCKVMNIPSFGDKQAEKVFDGLEYKVNHICFVDTDVIYKLLFSGKGKTADKIKEGLDTLLPQRSLAQTITSMSFTDCGEKCAEQCARYLTHNEYDFSGLSSQAYKWCMDENSKELRNLKVVLKHKDNVSNGHEFDKYISDYINENKNETIKVILTGSPNSFSNKKDFLAHHTEYSETTKWGECEILFTGDLTSESSKMKKAKKLGIRIEEY